MIKKIFLISFLGLFLVTGTWAATSSGSVDIGATITDGGGGGGGGDPTPIISEVLFIDPEDGNLIENCGTVNIDFNTGYNIYSDSQLLRTEEASTSAEFGYRLSEDNDFIILIDENLSSVHSFSAEGLLIGRIYDYYIKAEAGDDVVQVEGSFITTCQLTAPQIIAKATNQGISLEVDYQGFHEQISQVKITKSIGDGERELFYQSLETPPDTEIIFDSQVDLNVNYCYQLSVFNGYEWSSEVMACAQRRIFEVNNLSISPGSTSLSLNWQNPQSVAASDFDFFGIKLFRSDENCNIQGNEILAGDYRQYTASGLQNNQNYYYKILVENTYGELSGGVCIGGRTQPEAFSYCINNINWTRADGAVNINWANPEIQDGFELDFVRWQRADSCAASFNEGQMVFSGLGQAFVDSGLDNNQTYYYQSFVGYNDSQLARCDCIMIGPYVIEDEPEEEIEQVLCPDCQITLDSPQYQFLVNQGLLSIIPDQNNRLAILTDWDLKIKVDRSSLDHPIVDLIAWFQDTYYYLSYNNATEDYSATIRMPSWSGETRLVLVAVYQDQAKSVDYYNLDIKPWGRVYNGDDDIEGVELILLQSGARMIGFGIENPKLTNDGGFYGFMAPNGSYQLSLNKNGYESLVVDIEVFDNIINSDWEIKKIQPSIVDLMDLAENTSRAIKENQIAIGAGLSTVAFVNLLAATPWFNLWSYFQYLFTQPLVWLFRQRKKGWGVVFDSITKEPIDLATVRLYNAQTKQVVQSKVTDKQGRYNFIIEEGFYYLVVTKPGYDFPTVILAGQENDRVYPDIYHGETIEIKQGEAGIVAANIPLDKEDIQVSDQKLIRDYWLNWVRGNISLVGPILAVVAFILAPTPISALFVLLHLVLFVLFSRLAKDKSARSWGVVCSQGNGRFLPRAVVRIFSPEYNRMIEAQVTDGRGRYGFLVDDNIYYVTASKEGFEQYKSANIDLTNKKTEDIVGKDILLKPISENNSQTSTTTTVVNQVFNQEKSANYENEKMSNFKQNNNNNLSDKDSERQ